MSRLSFSSSPSSAFAYCFSDSSAHALTRIYESDCQVAIWRNAFSELLLKQIEASLNQGKSLDIELIASVDSFEPDLLKALARFCSAPEFAESILRLIDMFGCLFDNKHIGIRIATLDAPMCPRFHVDKLLCRMICTLSGAGTQWLPYSAGYQLEHILPDASNVAANDILSLNCGDVGLFKGSKWPDAEHLAVVHRSPIQTNNIKRFVLTLDLA
ncbi:hypothetical protein PALB_34190 [Pseudoalteromonas luteoviolacea B = ATCC 29581]|nr:hypothetical protein PALB_34190 [Pseudoalteromonas luteoviolacea B = ATCC 29581]